MGLLKGFPADPYEIIPPSVRTFPTEQQTPPLVPLIRERVKAWRDEGYPKTSDTTRELLRWWFEKKHIVEGKDGKWSQFRYYFAQRESVESVIFLYEAEGCRKPEDLLRYDQRGRLRRSDFDEHWLRLVCKQATGTGKTKVLALLLAWAYFHKKYEEGSGLSTNFLLITPNIIVLDRIRRDFEGLKIFKQDPMLPDDGVGGRNWEPDFHPAVHIQDDIKPLGAHGNIFLTNTHWLYETKEKAEDGESYFLGPKPGDKGLNVGEYLCGEESISDIVVFNDEAHHIHNEELAWFKSIGRLRDNLVQKGGGLSIQLDVTATPKDQKGNLFPQIIADYPLAEAIGQRVVKDPVVPDASSRPKLIKDSTGDFAIDHADYIHLGYQEWKKSTKVHQKLGEKAVLFIMVDVTKNADTVKDFLERKYVDLQGKVFVIHTNKDGDIIGEKGGKDKKELQKLRKTANSMDSYDNPYKVIVSVLMLKEGWDIKNVTTIVGLRAFTSKTLPEQTLGRGLRKMYAGGGIEKLSAIGTKDFLELVDKLKKDGVDLSEVAMGGSDTDMVLIEVDANKDLNALDIEIPLLKDCFRREYKNLNQLDINALEVEIERYVDRSEETTKEIRFVHILDGSQSHKTDLQGPIVRDINELLSHITATICASLKIVGQHSTLYGKIKQLIQHKLFGKTVDLEDRNILKSVANDMVGKIEAIIKKGVNDLILIESEKGKLAMLAVRDTRDFWFASSARFLDSEKCMFNKIIGDSDFELKFAAFLDGCRDVQAFVKCYIQIGFAIEYINAKGEVSKYHPDFVVRTKGGKHYVIETKGGPYDKLEDDPLKCERLKHWCEEVSGRTPQHWEGLYILQSKWEATINKPEHFSTMEQMFSIK